MESHLRGFRGHAEGVPGVGGAEEVSSRPGEVLDVTPSASGVYFHMHKVTLFVTLCKHMAVLVHHIQLTIRLPTVVIVAPQGRRCVRWRYSQLSFSKASELVRDGAPNPPC